MQNKYVYAFLKDPLLRTLLICCIIGIVFGVMLVRWEKSQIMQMESMRVKQALVAQIPSLRAKIAAIEGAVNGLALKGIISEPYPMAVINNKLIKIGGMIDGKRVTAITSHHVAVCNEASGKCIDLVLK